MSVIKVLPLFPFQYLSIFSTDQPPPAVSVSESVASICDRRLLNANVQPAPRRRTVRMRDTVYRLAAAFYCYIRRTCCYSTATTFAA